MTTDTVSPLRQRVMSTDETKRLLAVAAAIGSCGRDLSPPRASEDSAVLRYLARYTHRVAISNRRLVALDDNGVTFKVEGLPHRRSRAIQVDDARYPPSCRKASTVSVITVGSRAKPASRISPTSASCLQSRSSRSMPSRLSTPSPKRQKRKSILVPAAAAACASSRPSCAGNSRRTPSPVSPKVRIDTS